FYPMWVAALITIVCVAALAFSIWWSKRGSMSANLVSAAEAAGLMDTESFETKPGTNEPLPIEPLYEEHVADIEPPAVEAPDAPHPERPKTITVEDPDEPDTK
ncbi:MAG: hypothetical protein ACK4P3_09415, partial [Fimbriimonadaceae bacterium]